MVFCGFVAVIVTASVALMQVRNLGELTVTCQIYGNITCGIAGQFEATHNQAVTRLNIFNSQIVEFDCKSLMSVKVYDFSKTSLLHNPIKIVIYHWRISNDNV